MNGLPIINQMSWAKRETLLTKKYKMILLLHAVSYRQQNRWRCCFGMLASLYFGMEQNKIFGRNFTLITIFNTNSYK